MVHTWSEGEHAFPWRFKKADADFAGRSLHGPLSAFEILPVVGSADFAAKVFSAHVGGLQDL